MKHCFYSIAAAAIVASSTFLNCQGNETARGEGVTLEATANQQWYRGNMHTHSHWSDGDDYLDMIALWYRQHGYQFLVFTDHNVLANTDRWIDVEKSAGGNVAFDKLHATVPQHTQVRTTHDGRLEVRLRTFDEVAEQFNNPGQFLLIQGEEISDSFDGLPIHLNATNLMELIPPMTGRTVLETIENNLRAVLVQRQRTGQPMIAHVNHPNFGFAITAEDLMQIQTDRFFEVYNGHPGVRNTGDELHAGTDRVWDIVLTWRLARLHLPIMYGLAVDDGHRYHNIPDRESNPGRGWVMVLADELSAPSLIAALEAGRFYASSGVTLGRIEASAEGLTVEVEPQGDETYKIEFLGTRHGFDATKERIRDKDGNPVRATQRYSRDIGATFATVAGTTATYTFVGDEIYVRARVTSSAPHPNPSELGEPQRAWVQPVVGPAARK